MQTWLIGVCRSHAEKAIDIITTILPADHLLLASSKRVKGQLHGVHSVVEADSTTGHKYTKYDVTFAK